MNFVFNDGGRSAAGYLGSTRDCVVRSIAIVTGMPYKQVYDDINKLSKKMSDKNSSSRTGVMKKTYKTYLKNLGYVYTPTMGIGTGCKVHLKAEELPAGRLLVSVSKHLTAVINGVLHDTYDCTRNNTRCVYGYWKKG